ncbi:hypothetical protein ACFQ0X_30310 [Streptomyces rectiviolaceus]|uniref:Helix-turn-helix domain-containing protein n=1 Tax=Streptomyces rectiviolaceus TaxID=332591 RepID=A0ABP6MDE6_9ACTN
MAASDHHTSAARAHTGRMVSQIIRPGHLTAHQTATVLGVSLDGVRQLVRRGQLTRSGGSPRQPWFKVQDVAALDAKRRTRAAT